MAKFPSEDHAAVSEAVAAAVLPSATEGEDGNAPPWCPDDEYTSEALFDVTSSRCALSGPGNDGQRFAHLQSIIHTDIIGREEFGRGMAAFWRRLVDKLDADAFFLQSSLTATGEKCRPVSVGMTQQSRLITAGAMRQWGTRLEEVNREVRQFGVAVPRRVETGNWLVITDCSNAFNTVKRTAVLAGVPNCAPGLTPFVTKCYGTRQVDVFF